MTTSQHPDDRGDTSDASQTGRAAESQHSLAEVVERRARETPDALAYVSPHDSASWRDYHERSQRLARLLVAEGLLPADAVSIAGIREVHARDPSRVEGLMRRNDRFVFFRTHDGEQWPRASLGMPLTPECSLATDKSIFPPGGMVLVVTTLPDGAGGQEPFCRLMLDQDSGGAIKGPGRADLYLGVGEDVGKIAGAQQALGELYYFLLRP